MRSETFLRPRQPTRGQEIVEFTILVTFFLIMFFCVIEVAIDAIQKFQMNHYALYAARTWSTCPCRLPGGASVQVNEALARVKLGEFLKKTATRRTMTGSDWWRVKYLWGFHSSSLHLSRFVLPTWAKKGPKPKPTGPVYLMPIPVRTPYASLVMGGRMDVNLSSVVPSAVRTILNALGINLPSLNLNLPKVEGFEIIPAETFIPMEREPAEHPAIYDNDTTIGWTDMVAGL